ncbi:LiaI-LiaF-like domain-containing protein [Massilia sp. S19_KUP03_FR1]|uniref:LiaI-LiaF-like domain-containing protein n=1 Tax=Massilia sp. S19_KUP03_FR1 TaxID=3025503 RepID=UPI002FCDCA98
MRSERSPRGRSSQVVLGVLAIGLGILFFLDNLDIVNFRHALPFWPLVLFVVGVVKICDSGSRNSLLVGAALAGAGVVMLLNRLGFFYISWRALWPLALVALGAAVLLRPSGRREETLKLAKDSTEQEDYVDVTAILGGFQRRVATRKLRGGEITAIMGGCELDMREASIDGEAVIHVFAVMGGITIKCPIDWTVVLEGTPILGGFDEKTVPAPDNRKRLVIRGYAIMGGVEIRN